MEFPLQVAQEILIRNADGTPAIQIGPGPEIDIDGTGGSIQLLGGTASGNIPTIFFNNVDNTNAAFINLGVHSTGFADIGIDGGSYTSVQYPAKTIRNRLYLVNPNASSAIGFSTTDTQQDIGGLAEWTDDRIAILLRNASSIATAQVLVINNGAVGADVPQIFLQAGDGTALNGPILFLDATRIIFEGVGSAASVLFDTDGYLKIFGETWHDLTPTNGWSNRGGTFPNYGYRVTPEKNVQFRGSLNSGTLTDNTPIASALPAAVRPPKDAVVHAGGAGSAPRIYIQASDGIPRVYGTTGPNLGFDGGQYSLIP